MTARTPAAPTASSRIVSIDIFRGLTMTVMVFVNALAEIRGIPQWSRHEPAVVDAMTYVDMVFPFFLFLVGLSLPLAIRARLKKNPSMPALWLHVILRSLSLVVLGLILANADAGSRTLMGLSPGVWGLLALGGGILLWNVYPGFASGSRLVLGLKLLGLALLVVMYAIFRRMVHTPDGTAHAAWLDFSYPEILGIIGYTYFAVCVLYIPTRRWVWAPLAWFAALIGFNCVSTAAHLGFADHPAWYLWPFNNGAFGAMVMAGAVVSTIFLGKHRWHAHGQKSLLAIAFGLATLASGGLLASLGISKIRATPTWALVSVGAATLFFTLIYWICDVRKHSRWAAFAHPAGANTLMTYLLPDLCYYGFLATGSTFYATHWSSGAPGAFKSALFTVCILALSALLTRCKVRMQL
ncbi:DUF5009 domain-containing protein [Silvibacterium dinghuense]|uniref:DUF5009 domain-containing protein n=1 Tax=Silvibacterium dinghuense TaxID=1560006 RepID=A0A4Q1SHG5_9BACT|nr:DUF5009 domain-containing protein [Silvibacterium dinghuense]RXS97021.1 DUF5009 domain-containing protein [Silvibacterium dinghuense]GGG95570.1 hypothetical protein GCM10011586_08280 [Silvibacterium dinghuense]